MALFPADVSMADPVLFVCNLGCVDNTNDMPTYMCPVGDRSVSA